MRYYFNPFPVDVRKLEGSHLGVLRNVAEGWYVDYKSDIVQPKQLSKHLSSFANQYGGWLFFGIRESKDRTAESFNGVSNELVESYLLKIREASCARVNPNVYYEERIIRGPVDEIGLADGKSIIVVYIPEGVDPPYIDSSGRVYRRIGDQSAPSAEQDRHILDRLWERGRVRREKAIGFLRKRPYQGHSIAPAVYVHFMTNPLFEKEFDRIDYDSFREILSGLPVDLGLSMPMNLVHSSLGGYIAKQTLGNDPLGLVASLRWWHDGNAVVAIPLNLVTYESLTKTKFSYENGFEFLEELKRQNLAAANVCDLTYFLVVIAGLFNQLKQVFIKTGNSENVVAAFSLENAMAMVPFINDVEYVNQTRELGAPIIEDSAVSIPERLDTDSIQDLIKLRIGNSEIPTDNFSSVVEVSPIYARLFHAIGIINRAEDINKFENIFKIGSYLMPPGDSR